MALRTVINAYKIGDEIMVVSMIDDNNSHKDVPIFPSFIPDARLSEKEAIKLQAPFDLTDLAHKGDIDEPEAEPEKYLNYNRAYYRGHFVN